MLEELRECLVKVEQGKTAPFIVKPAGGSFGRGIFFLDKVEQVRFFIHVSAKNTNLDWKYSQRHEVCDFALH